MAWSPDGRQIAFSRSLSNSARDLYVIPSQGGEARRLTFDNQITEGFACDDRQPRPGVFVLSIWWTGSMAHPGEGRHPGADRNGRAPSVFPGNCAPGQPAGIRRFVHRLQYLGIRVARRGCRPQMPDLFDLEDDSPRYSPDGRKIVFVSKRTGSEELVADSDGMYAMQLTSIGGPPVGSPRWSPDSPRLPHILNRWAPACSARQAAWV